MSGRHPPISSPMHASPPGQPYRYRTHLALIAANRNARDEGPGARCRNNRRVRGRVDATQESSRPGSPMVRLKQRDAETPSLLRLHDY